MPAYAGNLQSCDNYCLKFLSEIKLFHIFVNHLVKLYG